VERGNRRPQKKKKKGGESPVSNFPDFTISLPALEKREERLMAELWLGKKRKKEKRGGVMVWVPLPFRDLRRGREERDGTRPEEEEGRCFPAFFPLPPRPATTQKEKKWEPVAAKKIGKKREGRTGCLLSSLF